jgi:hypothetical protein
MQSKNAISTDLPAHHVAPHQMRARWRTQGGSGKRSLGVGVLAERGHPHEVRATIENRAQRSSGPKVPEGTTAKLGR